MLSIRTAGPEDLALLADIGTRTYLDHYRDFWTPEGLAGYLALHFAPDVLRALLADPGVRYNLVFDADTIVGFTKVNRDRAVPDGEPRVWLNVLESNAAAWRFYARKGFVRAAGDYAFDTGRGRHAMWLMVRET